jgi:hypothetical protein
MRLSILDHAHRPAETVKLRMMRTFGLPVLDVVKTFMYRPEFFGQAFCDLGQPFCEANSVDFSDYRGWSFRVEDQFRHSDGGVAESVRRIEANIRDVNPKTGFQSHLGNIRCKGAAKRLQNNASPVIADESIGK